MPRKFDENIGTVPKPASVTRISGVAARGPCTIIKVSVSACVLQRVDTENCPTATRRLPRFRVETDVLTMLPRGLCMSHIRQEMGQCKRGASFNGRPARRQGRVAYSRLPPDCGTSPLTGLKRRRRPMTRQPAPPPRPPRSSATWSARRG